MGLLSSVFKKQPVEPEKSNTIEEMLLKQEQGQPLRVEEEPELEPEQYEPDEPEEEEDEMELKLSRKVTVTYLKDTLGTPIPTTEIFYNVTDIEYGKRWTTFKFPTLERIFLRTKLIRRMENEWMSVADNSKMLKDFCWVCLNDGKETPATGKKLGYPVCNAHNNDDFDTDYMEELVNDLFDDEEDASA